MHLVAGHVTLQRGQPTGVCLQALRLWAGQDVGWGQVGDDASAFICMRIERPAINSYSYQPNNVTCSIYAGSCFQQTTYYLCGAIQLSATMSRQPCTSCRRTG